MTPLTLPCASTGIKKSNGPALAVFQSPVKIARTSADTDGASKSEHCEFPSESDLKAARAVLARPLPFYD